ncbi:MAG: glycosyltransferase family 2 protein [Candidatus Omnitrophica bacterium]|nr:glycosyltransferase family 2 protein [Candidatus Omnitrophota bacterium]MBU4149933.1 glycosyltransferase family 2 protein [Candidatus Omnitrophota bacterium]
MISIIIANYNKKDLLKRCMDSVRGQGFKDIEIIVVDNASTDGSVEMVAGYYPEAKLIRNTRNLLFCRAHNQGIDASKGNFILCLNNDVMLDKDYLKEALSAIGQDARIGMVSGKILRMDKTTIDSTGLFVGRNRKAIERGYRKIDRGQYDRPGYVFGVSGSCAFFRKRTLVDVKDEYGYFDERFGFYYEDLDLCWRAQRKGWKAYYTPKAVACHVRAATALIYKVGTRKRWNLPYLQPGLEARYIKNRYRCVRKNDSAVKFLINLPFIILYELKLWTYLGLKHVFMSGGE